MPTYTFKNKETEEIFEIVMKISEYDDYLKENPEVERFYDYIPTLGDPLRLGIRKPPSDFQHGVIDRIKAANPHHNIKSRWDTGSRSEY